MPDLQTTTFVEILKSIAENVPPEAPDSEDPIPTFWDRFELLQETLRNNRPLRPLMDMLDRDTARPTFDWNGVQIVSDTIRVGQNFTAEELNHGLNGLIRALLAQEAIEVEAK